MSIFSVGLFAKIRYQNGFAQLIQIPKLDAPSSDIFKHSTGGQHFTVLLYCWVYGRPRKDCFHICAAQYTTVNLDANGNYSRHLALFGTTRMTYINGWLSTSGASRELPALMNLPERFKLRRFVRCSAYRLFRPDFVCTGALYAPDIGKDWACWNMASSCFPAFPT